MIDFGGRLYDNFPVFRACRDNSGRPAGSEERRTLEEIYSKENLTYEDADMVVNILDKLNSEGYARNMARGYYNEALVELDGIDLPSPARERMKQVTAYLASQAHQEA